MSNNKLVHDASASTKGTVYQLYVAVQKCFELVSGQKVLIEQAGDVTISDSQQVETKLYQDPLTDNHLNFWKTLNNWMQDTFDDTGYSSLILYTTQEFGEHCTLAEWNEAGQSRRFEILETIHNQAEEREAQRKNKNSTEVRSIPEALSLQRRVLDAAKRDKLRRVIEKFVIASRSPLLAELYKRISDQYCKGILDGKRLDFLNSLLGFVISPDAIHDNSWEITYKQFDAKVGELRPLYARETRIFPTKHFDSATTPSESDIEPYHGRLFVQKINDINYRDVIAQAIQEYIGASRTVLEEFKNYEVPLSRHENYEKETLTVFQARYRIAARNISDVIRDSKNFFDQISAEEPPSFAGFDKPPRAFRNGVIHMNCDDSEKTLKWRLEDK
jgi:hypothetical protein